MYRTTVITNLARNLLMWVLENEDNCIIHTLSYGPKVATENGNRNSTLNKGTNSLLTSEYL